MRPVLLLLLFAGCHAPEHVYVIGDSNTCFHRPCAADMWPEVLQAAVGTRAVIDNWGEMGMSAGDYSAKGLGAFAARPHVEEMAAAVHLANACPYTSPTVVIALGTNDLAWAPDAAAIPDAILAIQTRVLAIAPCARVYIATVPPRFDRPTAVRAVNAGLRLRVPLDHLIDFDSGVTAADLKDGLHFTSEGQVVRAARARAALFSVTGR